MEKESTSSRDVAFVVYTVIANGGCWMGIFGAIQRLCDIAYYSKMEGDSPTHPSSIFLFMVCCITYITGYSTLTKTIESSPVKKFLVHLGRELTLSEKLWFILGPTVVNSFIAFGIFSTMDLYEIVMCFVTLLICNWFSFQWVIKGR